MPTKNGVVNSNTHMWHKPSFSIKVLNTVLLGVSLITVIGPIVTIAYFLAVA